MNEITWQSQEVLGVKKDYDNYLLILEGGKY